jgi:hypothetical protein
MYTIVYHCLNIVDYDCELGVKLGPLATIPRSNVASMHILGCNRFECKKIPTRDFQKYEGSSIKTAVFLVANLR